MKTRTKIFMIFILLIITAFGVYSFLRGKVYVAGTTLQENDALADKFTLNISEKQMKDDYKNIYNISYNQKINENISLNFETTAMAQIRGENVTFTNYCTENVTTTQGNVCVENNIMAAIISGAGIENKGYKYVTEEGEYYSSGVQLAIWEFWNAWVENSGAKANGFEKGIGNGTITENGQNGEQQRKNAQALAAKQEYNVNIYFLKYLTKNNSIMTEYAMQEIDNQPNLILIQILDENGEIIEDVAKNSDIQLEVTNTGSEIITEEEEIVYDLKIYNKSKDEQENLVLTNKLSKYVTLVKVEQVINDEHAELKKDTDYKYDESTNKITIDIDKINGSSPKTEVDETTGETIEYTEWGAKTYQITVKANNLAEGIYSQEMSNVTKVHKNKILLAQKELIDTISNTILEIETIKMPENITENEECTIGLKITNKGLIKANNVNVQISIPEDILMRTYKVSVLNENGEEESVTDGTATNKFSKSAIEILTQKTVYIQLYGTIKDVYESKEITITGKVNNEEIQWNTKIRDEYEEIL